MSHALVEYKLIFIDIVRRIEALPRELIDHIILQYIRAQSPRTIDVQHDGSLLVTIGGVVLLRKRNNEPFKRVIKRLFQRFLAAARAYSKETHDKLHEIVYGKDTVRAIVESSVVLVSPNKGPPMWPAPNGIDYDVTMWPPRFHFFGEFEKDIKHVDLTIAIGVGIDGRPGTRYFKDLFSVTEHLPEASLSSLRVRFVEKLFGNVWESAYRTAPRAPVLLPREGITVFYEEMETVIESLKGLDMENLSKSFVFRHQYIDMEFGLYHHRIGPTPDWAPKVHDEEVLMRNETAEKVVKEAVHNHGLEIFV